MLQFDKERLRDWAKLFFSDSGLTGKEKARRW